MKIAYWDSETSSQKEREMTQEELVQRAADIAASAAPIVPDKVTRRQARQALLLRGYLDQVPIAIAAIADDTERRLAEIEWLDSQEFERYRPLVIRIGAALSMNLDELFIFASTL